MRMYGLGTAPLLLFAPSLVLEALNQSAARMCRLLHCENASTTTKQTAERHSSPSLQRAVLQLQTTTTLLALLHVTRHLDQHACKRLLSNRLESATPRLGKSTRHLGLSLAHPSQRQRNAIVHSRLG